MPLNKIPNIQRSDLQELKGLNERTLRFFEAIAPVVADLTAQVGTVDPEGVVQANSNRTYVNYSTGKLWINTNPVERSLTGWVIA